MSDSDGYQTGALITGFLVFIGSWIYAIVNYGFFLGIGLGWLPSLIIAFLAGLLWPLVALVAIGGILFIIWAFNQ